MTKGFGKKVLSASISLALALSLMPGVVMAEESETIESESFQVIENIQTEVVSEEANIVADIATEDNKEEVVISGVYTAQDIIEYTEEIQGEKIDVADIETEAVTEDVEEETVVEEAEEIVAEETVEEETEETAAEETAEEASSASEKTVELSVEEEILVKYLGSADLSEDEIFELVCSMDYEDLEAAYAEVEAYAKSLAEDELDGVSKELVYFANALEEVMTPALFSKTVSVCDGSVSVTDSVGTGSLSGDVVTITAKGSWFSQKTNNISVTNETGKNVTLSFDYTTSKCNSFTINGASVSESGTYSSELTADGSITIVMTSNSIINTTATLKLSNFSIVEAAEASQITFIYDQTLGSITVDGTSVDSGYSAPVSFETGAALTATANSGATFLGWRNTKTGAVVATDGTLKSGEDITVEAVFVNASSKPYFGIGSSYLFDDLNQAAQTAVNASTKVVHLANSATLGAGTYTIPQGVTLLMPFDSANTLYTTMPGCVATGLMAILNGGKDYIDGDYTTPTLYRKLTMADGANLVINGALSVSNRIYSGNAGYRAGSPTGPISMIQMLEGSNITVNSGAAAYVYGYIYGEGTMNIKSGATVYECMQILDFRGGTCTTNMAADDYSVFPFSQYYVQNIEVSAIYEGGATECVVSAFTISKMLNTAAIPFLGSSGSMFVPETGTTFTKKFDPATGRLTATADGNISISSMEASLGGTDLNTADYVLPISSSITINVNSGTITVNQDLALLPSAELNIAEGAVLDIASGRNAYAYDIDEWKGMGFVYNRGGFSDGDQSWLTYTATTTSTKQTLGDAKIDVNGEIIGNGFIYTSKGGAQITSSKGTGKVTLVNWDTTESPVTYELVGAPSDDVITYTEIPVTMVKLMNSDGSFTETVNVASGITPRTGEYLYEDGRWAEWLPGIYFDANGGEGSMDPIYSDLTASITLTQNTFTKSGYNFIGWGLAPDADVTFSDGAVVGIVDDEITLYAVWEKAACEHINTEPAVPAKAATCCEPGTTAGLKCSDCQEVLEEPVEIPIDADAHSFTNYVYNNDATCEADGTKTATCDHGCGAEDTITAEGTALGHSFTNYVYNNDATCEADGTKTAVCDHGCGAEDTIAAEGTALGHSFTTYVSDNNASLTVFGTRTAKCDHGCEETHTEIDLGVLSVTVNGASFEVAVDEYVGTGRVFVALYNASDRMLSAQFATITEGAANVTFDSISGATYAKVFAWDMFSKPIADYLKQNL